MPPPLFAVFPETWLIGTATQLPTAWLFRIRLRQSGGQLLALVLGVVLPALLAGAAAEAYGIPVRDLLAERTIERLEGPGAVEDFDLAIIDYFKEHPDSLPLGLGLGNAHLYAGPYLLPEHKLYAEGNVFIAKTQYIKLISEQGVIGLLFFIVWYVFLLIDAAHAVRRSGAAALNAVLPIGTTVVIAYFATSQLTAEFWTTAGVLAAVCAIGQRRDSAAPVLAQPA